MHELERLLLHSLMRTIEGMQGSLQQNPQQEHVQTKLSRTPYMMAAYLLGLTGPSVDASDWASADSGSGEGGWESCLSGSVARRVSMLAGFAGPCTIHTRMMWQNAYITKLMLMITSSQHQGCLNDGHGLDLAGLCTMCE